MANHASAKKAHRHSVQRNLINKNRLSRIKTFVKKVVEAITSGKKDVATAALVHAQSEIMKGVSHNILKLNTASRKVSRLSKKVKEMSQ